MGPLPRRAGLDAAPSAPRTALFSALPPWARVWRRWKRPCCSHSGGWPRAAHARLDPRDPAPSSRFTSAAPFSIHFTHPFPSVPRKVLPSSLESSLFFPAPLFLPEPSCRPGLQFPSLSPLLFGGRDSFLGCASRCLLRNRDNDHNTGPRSTGGDTGVDFSVRRSVLKVKSSLDGLLHRRLIS